MDIMKKYNQGDLDEVPSAKTANDPMNLPADEVGGENVDAPKIKISSSRIRELIKSKQSIDSMVPKEVMKFLKLNN